MSIKDKITAMFSFRVFQNKWSKRIFILFLLLTIILCLRSCISGESTTTNKKVYRIARDSSWYPLKLLGRERNLTAFTTDLMGQIAMEANLHYEWAETTPNYLLEGLLNANYDAVLSSLRPNVVNQENYIFSDLFFQLGPVFLVPQESNLNTLTDMQGHMIGMIAGTSVAFNAIREKGAHAYDLTFLSFNGINSLFQAMNHQQIDAIIIDVLTAYTLINGIYAGKLKVITLPLTDEGLRLIALKQPSAENLIKKFNESLHQLKESGKYTQLIDKWNLISPKQNYQVVPSPE